MMSQSSSDSINSDLQLQASPINPNESKVQEESLAVLKELGESFELNKEINNEKNPGPILKAIEAKKEKKLPKAKNWLFTLNQIDKWEGENGLKNYLTGLKLLNYIIATKELAPTTGHPHIHAYCQFTNTFAPSKAKLNKLGVRIDLCRGSPQQNIEYIKKTKEPDKAGEIILEWGEPRLTGNVPNIENAMLMEDKELEELPLAYYNIVKKIQDRRSGRYNPLQDAKKVQVFYIYGPSGYGKTIYAKIAMAKLGKPYDKVSFKNDFWDGVKEDGEVAFYDEFRDSDMKPSEFIKFIDYSRHSMNIKGGSVVNNYKYIFITSIQRPAALWPNMKNGEESMVQWMRRIKAINIEDHKKEDILAKYLELIGEKDNEPEFDISNII